MFRFNLNPEISALVKHHPFRLMGETRGSAILYAMLFIAVLALFGTALTSTVIFESRDVSQKLHRSQAFYLAEAGIQRATYEKEEGTFASTLDTGSYSVDVTWWATDEIDNDNDGYIDDTDEGEYYSIVSTGTADDKTETLKAVAQREKEAHELFYHHAIYVGNTSGEPYTLELSGNGGSADDINGDIYANGNADVSGNAQVTVAELYTDTNGNGEWDPAEPYVDSNSNGYYDFGIEATGAISGVSGTTGGDPPINPPELWDADYETTADVKVLEEFQAYYNQAGTLVQRSNTGIESNANPGSMYDKVWTVPSTYASHIFVLHVLTDFGPVDDIQVTDNPNFFLGDWHNKSGWYWSGEKITVRPEHNNLTYFVDGNLWIETNGYGPTLYSQSSTVGTNLTIVVRGNIYIADKLIYQRKWLDGIALIAMTDGESYTDRGNGVYDLGEVYDDLNDDGNWDVGEVYIDLPDWQYTPGVDDLHDYGDDGIPGTGDAGEGNGTYDGNWENSGNIFLGDPNLGPLGEVNAFLYAQNDFVDYVLNDVGEPEDFEIYGTMSAGNHVRINRSVDYLGTQHTKMTVNFDDRLRTGELALPGLPKGQNRIVEGQAWDILSWYH